MLKLRITADRRALFCVGSCCLPLPLAAARGRFPLSMPPSHRFNALVAGRNAHSHGPRPPHPHLWPTSVCVKAPDAGSHSRTCGSCAAAATRQCVVLTLLMATPATFAGRPNVHTTSTLNAGHV